MKLQSYVITQALRNGKVDCAIDLVLQYFNLSRPSCEPKWILNSPYEPLSIAMWGESRYRYYSWSSDTGFHTTDDSGSTDRRAVKLIAMNVFMHKG